MESLCLKDFYSLSETFSSSIMHVEPVDFLDSNFSDLLKGEYKNIILPLVFKQECGKKLTDMIRTGLGSLFLISQRMKDIIESHHLTGWKIFSVKILDKKNNEIAGYHGLSITGKCGPPDYNKCGIIEKQMVPTGPVTKYYKGWHVGLDKWDGTDFFIPEGTTGIVISKRAADILKKAKITNLELENLCDRETPTYAVLKKNAL